MAISYVVSSGYLRVSYSNGHLCAILRKALGWSFFFCFLIMTVLLGGCCGSNPQLGLVHAIYIYGQASGVPSPPPPPPLGGGGGAGVCGKGWWGGAGGRPGLTRKPFASRKPYNVARAPVSSNLNL